MQMALLSGAGTVVVRRWTGGGDANPEDCASQYQQKRTIKQAGGPQGCGGVVGVLGEWACRDGAPRWAAR